MTRGTHQVAAFASGLGALALAQSISTSPPSNWGLASIAGLASEFLGLPVSGGQIPWLAATIYVVFAILGGVAPDVDRSGSFWVRILSATLLRGHRHLSHSLLGAASAALLFYVVLLPLGPLLTFPVGLIWLGFVSGYLSHLLLDSMTSEGVPLLFPLPIYFGIPPVSMLRIRTGGLAEQFVVLPGLLLLIAWLGFAQGHVLAALLSVFG